MSAKRPETRDAVQAVHTLQEVLCESLGLEYLEGPEYKLLMRLVFQTYNKAIGEDDE